MFCGGTDTPPCQRSEVNGDISPSLGLRGRDIEPLTEPRITHEQITASDKPSHKVLGTDSLHLHLGEPRLNKAEGRMQGGGGGAERGARQVPVGRAQEKHTGDGRALPVSLASTSRNAGGYVPEPGQAGGQVGRRGWGPSPTAGELRPAVCVYSLQGVAGAEYSSFRWMIK